MCRQVPAFWIAGKDLTNIVGEGCTMSRILKIVPSPDLCGNPSALHNASIALPHTVASSIPLPFQ